jgi:hypothetical protein
MLDFRHHPMMMMNRQRENMQFNRVNAHTVDAARQMYALRKLNEYPNTILIKNALDPMSSADRLVMTTSKQQDRS